MCRLLGYATPTALSLNELLGAPQAATFLSMSRLHADGWGSAWLNEAGAVEQLRDPSSPRPDVADSASSRTVAAPARARLMHLRMATAGLPITLDNTHPFLADGIAFAHNGAITPTDALAGLLDSPTAATVSGQTDSELYFALIRQHLTQIGDLYKAVCVAVSTLRELYPHRSLNAMLLSDEELIVVHSSELVPLPLKEFAASGIAEAELPAGHLDDYFQIAYHRSDDGTILFSSTGIDVTGWTPLPPASVAAVDLETGALRIQTLPC